MIESILKIIPLFVASFAAIWGVYIFYKQQRFKRLQNLSALWKEFFKSEELLNLFGIMDEAELGGTEAMDKIVETPIILKLKYLALIEEVAMYTDNFEVDKEYSKYMFQWHFYYVYQSKNTRKIFWESLGGEEEMNKEYWRKSRELAAEFIPAGEIING